MKAITAKNKIEKYCLEMIEAGNLSPDQFADAIKKVRKQAFADVKPRTQTLPKIFTQSELDAFFAAIDNPTDELAFRIIYSTAARIDEFTRIAVSDIDYDDGVLVIPQGKGGKRRHVPISKSLLLPIKQLAAERRRWLFENGDGNPYSSRLWQIKMKRYAEKAGFAGDTLSKATPHTLRHTRATWWLNNNLNIREVQMMLGHSNLNTTAIYTHISLKNIAGKIDDLEKE